MSIDDIVSGIKEKANLGPETAAGVDAITLREVTSVITQITSALFGFLVTIIILTVPMIVTLELIYIIFPATRKVVEGSIGKLEQYKVKVASVSKRGIELTLRDARQAVFEAETVKTGKSALTIYLVNKCKSIMFITFVLALVLLGIGTFVDVIGNMFSGVFKLISDFIYVVSGK